MFSLAVEGKYMEKEMKNENSRLPNWVQARLNKDNFWNLVFAFGFILGMGLIFAIAPKAPTPWPAHVSVIFWSVLIGIPMLVRFGAKTSFKDGKFCNKEGKELNLESQFPHGFFVIATTAAAIILTGLISDSFPKPHSSTYNFFCMSIFLFEFFFIPVLFFIFKNCPISILFNLQFYKRNMRFAKSSSVNWTHDPQQYNVAGNIYYNNHNSYYLNNHHR